MEKMIEYIHKMPGRGRTLKKNETYEMPINPGKAAAEEWLCYNYGEPSKELKRKWGLLNLKFCMDSSKSDV